MPRRSLPLADEAGLATPARLINEMAHDQVDMVNFGTQGLTLFRS